MMTHHPDHVNVVTRMEGTTYWSGCGAHAERVHELDQCCCLDMSLLKTGKTQFYQGPIGKRNPPLQQQKPFSAMKEEELGQELSGGGIYEVKKRNSYKTFSMKVCML